MNDARHRTRSFKKRIIAGKIVCKIDDLVIKFCRDGFTVYNTLVAPAHTHNGSGMKIIHMSTP